MSDSRRLLWVGTLLAGLAGISLLGWQLAIFISQPSKGEPPATLTAVSLPPTRTAETAALPAPNTPPPFTICLPEEPNTLNPLAEQNQAAQQLQPALFEPLITHRSYGYQPHTLIKLPNLADGDAFFQTVTVQTGDIVVDANNQLTFLAEGMLLKTASGSRIPFSGEPVELQQLVAEFTFVPTSWADGTAVTATDSVFAFKLASTVGTLAEQFVQDRTARYEEIGAQSVRWIGVPGFYSRTYSRNVWAPLPQHLWQNILPEEMRFLPELNRQPQGNGPYIVGEWVSGNYLRLTANPAYYRTAEQLPRQPEIIVRFLPDSRDLLNAIITGACDLVPEDGVDAEQTETILAAASNGLLMPHFASGRVYELLVFGVNSANDYGDGLGRPDWFETAVVRQAIAHCVDRQALVETLFFDQATLLNSYLPDSHPLRDDTLPPLSYDPEKGNMLLDQANLLDSDGDGIREDATSKRPFQISLGISSQTASNQTLAQLLQQDLLHCGIDLALNFYPPNEWFAAQESSPLFGRRFDVGHLAWPVGEEPLCLLFSGREISGSPQSINPATREAYLGWTTSNPTGWWLPKFDDACDKAQQALPGTAVYKQTHATAQQLFAANLPALPLFLRFKLALTSPQVTGFSLDPTAASNLLDIVHFDKETP